MNISNMLNKLQIGLKKSLKASGDKSYLITQKIEFLGQIISDGIEGAHPKRAECIENMPRAKTIADLQRLLESTLRNTPR